MSKRLLPALVGTLVAFGVVTGFQAAGGQPADLHCPNHESNAKFIGGGTFTFDGVQFASAGNTLTITNGNAQSVTVTWCAKGGTNFYNGGHTSGVRSTTLGAGGSQSFTFNQGVSYLVVYSVVETGNGGGGGGGGGNGDNGGGGGGGGGGNGDNGGGGGGGGGTDNGGDGGTGTAGPADVIEGEAPLTG